MKGRCGLTFTAYWTVLLPNLGRENTNCNVGVTMGSGSGSDPGVVNVDGGVDASVEEVLPASGLGNIGDARRAEVEHRIRAYPSAVHFVYIIIL